MSPPPPSIGQILAHFRIVEQIGAGGMGVVYRAHDDQLERDVAIKVLPPGTLANEAARKQFRKEALAHKSVVFSGRRKRFTGEQKTAGVIGDRERITVLAIAEQELAFVIRTPELIGPLSQR
jgi:hypothetical protein